MLLQKLQSFGDHMGNFNAGFHSRIILHNFALIFVQLETLANFPNVYIAGSASVSSLFSSPSVDDLVSSSSSSFLDTRQWPSICSSISSSTSEYPSPSTCLVL